MRLSQAYKSHRLMAARVPVLLAITLLFSTFPIAPAPVANDLRRCAAGISCPEGLTPADAKGQIGQVPVDPMPNEAPLSGGPAVVPSGPPFAAKQPALQAGPSVTDTNSAAVADAGSAKPQIPRWEGGEITPRVTAGTTLQIVGLQDNPGQVWLVTPEGDEIERTLELTDGRPGEALFTVPMPPQGWTIGGLYTITFDNLDEGLEYELVAVRPVPQAVALLVDLSVSAVVQALQQQGTDPEVLLRRYRQDPSSLEPREAAAGTVLAIYQDAQGHPVTGFLRSGDMRDFGGGTGEDPERLQETLDAYATALLFDRLNPDALTAPKPEFLNRIRFLEPEQQIGDGNVIAPRVWAPRVWRISNFSLPLDVPEPVAIGGFEDFGRAIEAGKQLDATRNVTVRTIKSELKLLEWTVGFHPQADVAIAVTGSFMTLIEQALKGYQHGFPNAIAVSARHVPPDILFADDSRPVTFKAEISAQSDPYIALFAQDGVDTSLALLTILPTMLNETLGRTKIGKGAKALKVVKTVSEKVDINKLMGITFSKKGKDEFGVLMGKTAALWKENLEQIEKKGGDAGTLAKYEVPGKIWGPYPVTEQNHKGYFTTLFNGDIRWSFGDFAAKACFAGTGRAHGVLQAIPEKFGGRHAATRLDWAVRRPVISLSVSPKRIRPGGTAQMTAETAGAESEAAEFSAPTLGGLAATGPLTAVYTAPNAPLDIKGSCSVPAILEASYPVDPSGICVPAPRAVDGLHIGTGDALISAPARLSCEPGQLVPFVVSHPDAPVQCTLQGPGELMQFGRTRKTYRCPARPGQGIARITCTSNPGGSDSCSPVIPVGVTMPDYGVWLELDVPSRGHNPRPEDHEFENTEYELLGYSNDECGAEKAMSGNRLLTAQALSGGVSGAHGMMFMLDRLDSVLGTTCGETTVPSSGGMMMVFESDEEINRLMEPLTAPDRVALPVGAATDVSVADASRIESGQPGTTIYKTYTGTFDASIAFQDKDTFSIFMRGQSSRTAGKSTGLLAASTDARFGVMRTFRIEEASRVTIEVDASGDGQFQMIATPLMVLDDRYPMGLTYGFETGPIATFTTRSGTQTMVLNLPAPPPDVDHADYVLQFSGGATEAETRHSRQSASGRLNLNIRIKTAIETTDPVTGAPTAPSEQQE